MSDASVDYDNPTGFKTRRFGLSSPGLAGEPYHRYSIELRYLRHYPA